MEQPGQHPAVVRAIRRLLHSSGIPHLRHLRDLG